MRSQKTGAFSFRLDPDLQPVITKWLTKNPGLNKSRLANLAIRQFITQNQTLLAVQTVTATHKEAKASLKKMMKTHKKALDELK